MKLEKDLISPEILADRWKMTPYTLAQWRWVKKGPRFTKIGRQIFYRISDVIHYEVTLSQMSIPQMSFSQLSNNDFEPQFKRNFKYDDYKRRDLNQNSDARIKKGSVSLKLEKVYNKIKAENKRRFQ